MLALGLEHIILLIFGYWSIFWRSFDGHVRLDDYTMIEMRVGLWSSAFPQFAAIGGFGWASLSTLGSIIALKFNLF